MKRRLPTHCSISLCSYTWTQWHTPHVEFPSSFFPSSSCQRRTSHAAWRKLTHCNTRVHVHCAAAELKTSVAQRQSRQGDFVLVCRCASQFSDALGVAWALVRAHWSGPGYGHTTYLVDRFFSPPGDWQPQLPFQPFPFFAWSVLSLWLLKASRPDRHDRLGVSLSVSSGARVFVAEGDPFCAWQACLEGVQASCLRSTSLVLQQATSSSTLWLQFVARIVSSDGVIRAGRT